MISRYTALGSALYVTSFHLPILRECQGSPAQFHAETRFVRPSFPPVASVENFAGPSAIERRGNWVKCGFPEKTRAPRRWKGRRSLRVVLSDRKAKFQDPRRARLNDESYFHPARSGVTELFELSQTKRLFISLSEKTDMDLYFGQKKKKRLRKCLSAWIILDFALSIWLLDHANFLLFRLSL